MEVAFSQLVEIFSEEAFLFTFQYENTSGRISTHWAFAIRRTPLSIVDCSIRYRPRFFDQVGHQTTYAYIGNKHFFTKSCHRQTYQNYEHTVPIDKILSVKNARSWISMVSYFKKLKRFG